MINELVIHLGDTKTGSTSIQKALVRNFCQVPGQSIIYPTKTHHVGLAKTLVEKRFFGERAARFGKVYDAFQNSAEGIGVVSAEYFQNVDPYVFKKAIEHYWPGLSDKIRLIAYVRPHAGKFVSAYAERTKLGIALKSMDDFFAYADRSGFLDYTPRFTKWQDVFGSQFSLRPFVRSKLHNGDIVEDFMHYVTQGGDYVVEGQTAENSSLTIAQLSIVREVHRVLDEKMGSNLNFELREARNNLGRIIMDYLKDVNFDSGDAKLGFPSSLVDKFKERYASDAEALDTVFFEGTPMQDDLAGLAEVATVTEQSLEVADHFNHGFLETVRVFANVASDLIVDDPSHVRKAIGKIRANRIKQEAESIS